MTDIDTDMIYKNFKSSVNMTAKEIKQWLTTDESKSVGIKRPGEKETIGRQSGQTDRQNSDYEKSRADARRFRPYAQSLFLYPSPQRPGTEKHHHLALALFADELGP